jgi:hypothetical protein
MITSCAVSAPLLPITGVSSRRHAAMNDFAGALLRNLVISILRINGTTNIAQALRHHAWDPLRPITILTTC